MKRKQFVKGIEQIAQEDPHKCNPVPMGFVHICLNFKYKSRKLVFHRVNRPYVRHPWQRRCGHFQEMKDKLYEEIELLDGASAEYDLETIRAGELTPVFFGSALK